MKLPRFKTLAEVECEHVARALDLCGGNITGAAKILGISRSTVYRFQARADELERRELEEKNKDELAGARAVQVAFSNFFR